MKRIDGTNTVDTGYSVMSFDPIWEPLQTIIPEPYGWMFMGTETYRDGTRLHSYKHRETRKYLRIDDTGKIQR